MKKVTLIFLVFAIATFTHAQDSDKVVVKGSEGELEMSPKYN